MREIKEETPMKFIWILVSLISAILEGTADRLADAIANKGNRMIAQGERTLQRADQMRNAPRVRAHRRAGHRRVKEFCDSYEQTRAAHDAWKREWVKHPYPWRIQL